MTSKITTFLGLAILGILSLHALVAQSEGDARIRSQNSAGSSDPSSTANPSPTPNPNTLDTDGDGIPDLIEAQYGMDPLAYSSGNNGIADGWWISKGMSPFSDPNADPDGDGRSNYQEFLDGTDPLAADANPHPGTTAPSTPSGLVLTTLPEGHNVLSWTNNSPAAGIIVERSSDGATWQTVGIVSGGQTTFTDATAQLEAVYFYRVVAFN